MRDDNVFTLNPTNLSLNRSIFNRKHQVKTSFSLGDIFPITFYRYARTKRSYSKIRFYPTNPTNFPL